MSRPRGRLWCVLLRLEEERCPWVSPQRSCGQRWRLLLPPTPHLFPVWAAVDAISVETPKEVLRAARGKSVTLPCAYSTSSPSRDGFIEWDKLLMTHTVRSPGKSGMGAREGRHWSPGGAAFSLTSDGCIDE